MKTAMLRTIASVILQAPTTQAGQTSAQAGVAEFAKVMGGIVGLILLCAVGTGLARRRPGRRFHRVHAGLALAFGAAVLVHATLLALQSGAPRSAWHYSGTIALLCAAAGAGTGLARRRFKRRFLPLHKALAGAAPVFALLHGLLA